MINNKLQTFFIAAIIIVVVGAVFYFGVLGTVVGGPMVVIVDGETVTPVKGTISLKNYEGIYETTYLGSISSRNGVTIGGNNDEGIYISNYISGGQKVVLDSSIRQIRETTKGSNYIETTFILPAGRIYGNCKLYAQNANSQQNGIIDCGIIKNGVLNTNIFSSRACFRGGVASDNNCGNENDPTNTFQNVNFDIILEEETTVTFFLRDLIPSSNEGTAFGSMTINFESFNNPVDDETGVEDDETGVEDDETTVEEDEEEDVINSDDITTGVVDDQPGTGVNTFNEDLVFLLGSGIVIFILIIILVVIIIWRLKN